MKSSTVINILFIYLILVGVMLLIVTEENVVGEQPCVDGNHNINLEGMMCEKTEITFFGINILYAFLFAIPIIPTFFIVWKLEDQL